VPLLEVLVALSEDQVSEVSTAASEAVEEVSAAFGEDSSMVEILESNLFRVAENLPSMFNRRGIFKQKTKTIAKTKI
jgi:putative heme iron utilization protein